MGLLPDTQNYGLCMRWECWERFPRHRDPDMHHDRCMTHVPWCMPGSLTIGFLWSRWRGKRYRHFRRMLNPQFCVSGKRPMLDNPPNSLHTHISRNLVHPPHPFRWLNHFAILHIALDYGEISHILYKRDLVRSELKVFDATPLSPSYFRIMILLLQSPLFCHPTGLALSIFVKLWVVHAPWMPGKFPRHRLQRKPLVSDPGMHHGTWISLTRGGEGNVPGIPGACTTHNFAYLVRGPWVLSDYFWVKILSFQMWHFLLGPQNPTSCFYWPVRVVVSFMWCYSIIHSIGLCECNIANTQNNRLMKKYMQPLD